ncbi:MAG: hypothetical protein ACUVSM_01920 [Armatimonadota bacterium]
MALRFVARVLTAIMVFPHLMTIVACTAVQAQAQAATYVAVIDFANVSKYGDSMISRLATDAVVVEMTNTANKFTVATRQQVEQARTELDLQYPLNLTGVMRIGERLGVDAVVVGEVREVKITDRPRQARVEIVVRMLDASSGEPINGAIARGASTPQPAFTGDDDVLITEAINNAAYVAVRRMVDYIIPEATVLNAMGTGRVLLNKGEQDGIQRGMEMIVSRNDEVIGKLRVTEVSNNDATAVVVSAVKGVKPQDKARAIFRLPAVASGSYGEPVTRISEGIIGAGRKKNNAAQILGFVLGVGLLVALAGSHSSHGETPGPAMEAAAGAPPALATPTGLPGVRVTLDPKRFGVTNANILQIKVYRSDQSTPIFGASRNLPFFVDYQLAPGADPLDVSYLVVGTDNTAEPEATDGTNPGVQPGQTYTYHASVVYRRQGVGTGGDDSTAGELTWIYEEGPVQLIGVATPLDPILRADLVQPPYNSAAVNPADVTFEWRTTLGADNYIVEVSRDPSFRTVIYRSPVVTASRFSDGEPLSLENVNLGSAAALADVTLYWRVGARNSGDRPGPIPDPGSGQRYIFSEVSQFRVAAGPPPPP